MKDNKRLELMFLLGGIVLCLISIFLYSQDKYFDYHWLVLILWLGSLVFSIFWATTFFPKKKCFLKKHKRELWFLIFLIFLSGFLRFYKINKIPLLNGDEARDAGFLPESFLRGEIRDFFGYGVYGIPNLFFILASGPHLLFGHSILAVRFFAAFFGVLAVILTYFLGKRLFNYRVGAVAGILMSFYHVHLQFSRSEFINNFDSFWAPLIVILLFETQRNLSAALLLGLSLGIASHFYQGIRAVLAFSAAYFLIWSLINFHKSFKAFLAKTGCFLLGIFLGLGPSVVVILTRLEEFLNTGTAGGPLFLKLSFLKFFEVFPGRLLRSFGALIYYQIDFHYRYGGPFLRFPLNLFFLVGVFFLIRNFYKKEFHIFLFWMAVVIFCNSTLLEGLNYTHRLLSLVPALMIVAGLGLVKLASIFKKWPAFYRLVLFLFVLVPIFLNLKSYFFDSAWENACDLNTKVANLAGNYAADFLPETKLYFLNSPRMGWKSVPSWEYLAPNAWMEDLPEEKLESIFSPWLQGKGELVFIALPERREDLAKIKEFWPGGLKRSHYYDDELCFMSYELD